MAKRKARKKLHGRERRLEKAPERVAAERGKPSNVIRRYRRYFGVDRECAISELQELGYEIDPQYLLNLRASLSKSARKGKRHEPITRSEFDEYHGIEPMSDDTYAYIAGYTSGGAAFGVTWEEMEELDRRTKADARIDQELGGTGFEQGFEGIFDEGPLEDRPDR
jgi:hypothetical protein